LRIAIVFIQRHNDSYPLNNRTYPGLAGGPDPGIQGPAETLLQAPGAPPHDPAADFDPLIPGCSQKSIFRSGEWFSKALKSVGRVSRAILGA
jgi:hypothetical protein